MNIGNVRVWAYITEYLHTNTVENTWNESFSEVAAQTTNSPNRAHPLRSPTILIRANSEEQTAFTRWQQIVASTLKILTASSRDGDSKGYPGPRGHEWRLTHGYGAELT